MDQWIAQTCVGQGHLSQTSEQVFWPRGQDTSEAKLDFHMLIQLQIYDYMFKIWVLPYCAFLKLSYGNSLSRTEEDADVSFLNLDISSWLYCHDEFGYIEQVHFAIAIAIASCLYVSMVIATHLYCEGDMYHLCFIMVLCLYCESALSWHHQLFSFGFTCAMYVLILIWNLNKDMHIYMWVF